jgi:hypothetical protein
MAAYLTITSVHWMLRRNNPTNPNEPQPLFLTKDHSRSDAVSREPGDEAVMRYMLVYQAT